MALRARKGRLLVCFVLLAGYRSRAAGNDTTCTWPTCAPVCDPCELEPLLLAEANAICKMGICVCKPLYCARGLECVLNTCTLGASPPLFEPTAALDLFNRLGPGIDAPFNASAAWWKDFTWEVSSDKPRTLLFLGAVMAVFTSILLCTGIEQKYGCLPKRPAILLGWAAMLVLAICFGLFFTHNSMMHTYEVSLIQLDGMHTQLSTALEYGMQLNRTCTTIQQTVRGLPSSCSNSLAERGMQEVVDLADIATESKFDDVYKLIATLQAMTMMTEEVKAAALGVRSQMKFLPIFPMIIMLAGVLLVVLATVVWWHCPHYHLTEMADMCMLRMGDCCIPLLAVTAAVLAAIYLEAGVVTATFCSRVDENVFSLVLSHNWNTTIKMKAMDPNELMQQASMYYLFGNHSNPMLAALEAAQSALVLMDNTLTKGESMMKMVELFCPGVKDVAISQWSQQVDTWVDHMNSSLTAAVVWPHYDGIVRTSICRNMVGSLAVLLIVSTSIGLCCFPMFALLAEYDLEEWIEEQEHADATPRELNGTPTNPAEYSLLQHRDRRTQGAKVDPYAPSHTDRGGWPALRAGHDAQPNGARALSSGPDYGAHAAGGSGGYGSYVAEGGYGDAGNAGYHNGFGGGHGLSSPTYTGMGYG